MTRTLMIQGTGSDVGKSLVVAGLCRAFARRGLRVRPFKPQNMSNNAAVTPDGGEIGRAQWVQARACGVAASVDMNPVLLKPHSGTGSQIVVQGRVAGQAEAGAYQAWKPKLLPAVLDSFARLKADADLVIVEGAGSASEINLRARDIANMGFARAANVPVVLVGDIDRGGVIAQIVGTQAVLDPADAAMIEGFIVNRFRGDPTLFADGMRLIAERTGWPALGLVPHCPAAALLPAEDSLALRGWRPNQSGTLTIAVPILPGISNFDDLDPLRGEPQVRLVTVTPGTPLPPEARLVILPGSKTTIADLDAFRREGWDIDLAAHMRRGGHLIGLCGGYQMLGRRIADPLGVEGPAREGRGSRLSRRGDGALDEQTPVAGVRRSRRRAVRRLRDAHGRNDPGRATVRPFRRRPRGRRGVRGRPGSPAAMCTACMPTIVSARRCWSASAPRATGAPTRRRRRRRWTLSARTWPRTSTSIGSYP